MKFDKTMVLTHTIRLAVLSDTICQDPCFQVSGFSSLVEDFGNHKALGVFALKGQVTDCSVAHAVSDCMLCSELICSLWFVADMSSWLCLRRKTFIGSCVFFSIFVLKISPQRNQIFYEFSIVLYLAFWKLCWPSFCFRIYYWHSSIDVL